MSSNASQIADGVFCGEGGGSSSFLHLRIASVFIILLCSMSAALFPVFAKRSKWLHVPPALFDFAKYFGSGVIIATAFIHLLDPALQELQSPCLGEAWQNYPYAMGIALASLFSIFAVEIVAFRWGTARLAALGISHDAHGHGLGGHASHGPEPHTRSMNLAEAEQSTLPRTPKDLEEGGSDKSLGNNDLPHSHSQDVEATDDNAADSGTAQVIGIGILEFGVVLHSVLIGLTLAVDPNFKILFVVIIFHQTFEGLGLGSRLAHLKLPERLSYVPTCGAMLYGCTTPIGIAAGLGVRSTYNPNTPQASITSGVLDATSAGILIYTGTVELLAHEFIFNKQMLHASNGKLLYALSCMIFGAGIMALLGRWA